jgi:hypothetical protein
MTLMTERVPNGISPFAARVSTGNVKRYPTNTAASGAMPTSRTRSGLRSGATAGAPIKSQVSVITTSIT